ncbi:hypothetical protein BCL50_1863 [Mycolicibacterium litorale]|nr:hypothetical protein BCL50_1863 [Mycolicibacterium litorale]
MRKTRQRVENIAPETRLLKHMPSSKLGVLVREAGYERGSRRLLEELSDRLREAGVDFSPELSDDANTPETTIHFFDAKRPVQGLQPARELFEEESQLQHFLWKNKHFLSQATKHLRLTDREKVLAPGSRPDLIAVDTKSKELVGIELKAGTPDEGIVAQAAKYMDALKTAAEAQGHKGARLMIITGQPNEQLAEQVQVHAEKVGVRCEWLLYRVRFELKKA